MRFTTLYTVHNKCTPYVAPLKINLLGVPEGNVLESILFSDESVIRVAFNCAAESVGFLGVGAVAASSIAGEGRKVARNLGRAACTTV